MSTFGDQLFQFGGVPVGNGMLPIMGNKDAKAYFVIPSVGNNDNSGLKITEPLDNVTNAYNKCVDKQGDVIYLINDGNTSGTSRISTIPLTWGKDNTHLVGLTAPTMISQRARLVPQSTTALTANPIIDVTGHSNIFANVQIAHFGANTDSIASRGVDVSGNRNYFYNCHIVGIPAANAGDEANACDLLIDGGQENTFERCTIGVDTVAKSTTNACLEMTTAAARNMFIDCIFPTWADNAGHLFVKVDGAGDIDRFTWFKNCLFVNGVASTGTTMTAATDVHASAGGMLVFQECCLIGATDWEAADSTNIYLMGSGAGGTAADQKEMGIAQTVDVS